MGGQRGGQGGESRYFLPKGSTQVSKKSARLQGHLLVLGKMEGRSEGWLGMKGTRKGEDVVVLTVSPDGMLLCCGFFWFILKNEE